MADVECLGVRGPGCGGGEACGAKSVRAMSLW